MDNNENRFDIILSNPPYDKSLHLKFLEKYIQLADKVISIQPVRWLQDPISKFKKSSDYNRYKESIIEHINDLEIIDSKLATNLFGGENTTTFGMDLGIYLCNKNGGWNNIFENKILEKVVSKTPGMPITKIKDITKKCFCLLRLINSDHAERGVKRNDKKNLDIIRSENYYGKYYVNGISTNGNTVEQNKKLNKHATNGTIKNWPVIEFNTEEECKNFYNFTKTMFFKYIYIKEKIDINIYPQYLPYMDDYTRKWTDNDLYEYFELTEDEIKQIEDEMNNL